MATTAASDTDRQRDDTLQEVALDCLRRLAEGETFLDESIERAHPDLMPELASELAELRRIHAARQLADHGSLGVPLAEPVPHVAVLRIRCPECHTPADIVADSDLKNVTCSSCGGQFSLVGRDDEVSGDTLLTKIGHFEIVEQIGVGGFGTVWKAHDKELDRLVAIKLPRRGQLGPDEAEQFLREARAAAQLRHPNIVSVHEVGRDGDRVYLVSDFVEGVSLAEWLIDERLSAPEAARLCQKIALALEHAHAAGIVHRDLKPANVLLDGAGEPHLTDFGLARRQTQETTVTVDGQFLGTPAYMSPEQARGESHTADQRSDIYSLGVILYELLTREVPFRGNPANLLHQIVNEDPRSPRAINRNVPRDLETITLKCLEKDPARRYATARELADDLGRFLRGEPIHARPVSRTERTWRWCRRNPRMAGLSAAVAALLLVIAAVTTYSSVRSGAAARVSRWQQYLSDMHSAANTWDQGDVGRVVNLLERNRPAPGEEDLRRFEWYYLWRQCQPSLEAPTLKHDYAISALAVTSDGSRIVAAQQSPSTGDVINVWDMSRGAKLWSIPGANHPPAIAISPDDRLMAVSNCEWVPSLWDLTTGNLVQELVGHTGSTRGVAFSPDVRLVATSGADGTVKVWNPLTGVLVKSLQNERVDLDYSVAFVSDSVDCGLAFSPDARTLAAGSSEGYVKFWNVTDWTLVQALPAHTGPVHTLVLSGDGKLLATGGADQIVRVWNTADRSLHTALVGHTESISAVDISADATTLASAGSQDGTVRIWDLNSGELRHVFKGHSGSVTRVRFAGNSRVVSGGADGAVRIWDLTRKYDVNTLHVHKSGSWSVAIGRDGKTVAAGAYLDPTIKVWDLESGRLLKSHKAATDDGREGIDALAISPDGRWLALGGNLTGLIELWNPSTNETVLLQHLGNDSGAITSLAWSTDGRTLVSGDASNNVILWDTITHKERLRLAGHNEWICSVALSPEDHTLVTRCQDGTLRIWDPPTGTLRKTIDIPAYWFSPLAFSSDGALLACADVHNVIQIRETTNWQVVRSATGHTGKVKGLAVSPDGRTLASASDDATIRLWEVATGEERCALRGHRGEVEAVKFTPDGQTLVSSSLDGTVRVWRTAQ